MILETQRLILRQLTVKDIDTLLPVLGDAEAMVYYPHPFSRDEVGQFISKQIMRYAKTGHGLWAMLLKTTGELIGDCGLALQDVELFGGALHGRFGQAHARHLVQQVGTLAETVGDTARQGRELFRRCVQLKFRETCQYSGSLR